MLLITLRTHATVEAELSADEILRARRPQHNALRLSDPLVCHWMWGIVLTLLFVRRSRH